MDATENLQKIQAEIEDAKKESQLQADEISLIAVSKTFDTTAIRPVLTVGHRVFGENRVQEAHQKWPELQKEFPDVELHLIGSLQSNKVKEAVALFDAIQTVDRPKIAQSLAKEMIRQEKQLQLFIQVNTGGEPQKAGILPQNADDFIGDCREKYGLTISGLMCIPPADENPGPHFALLYQIAKRNNLAKLSMGMSADFPTAIRFGATHVRVGSAIFGKRDKGILS